MDAKQAPTCACSGSRTTPSSTTPNSRTGRDHTVLLSPMALAALEDTRL